MSNTQLSDFVGGRKAFPELFLSSKVDWQKISDFALSDRVIQIKSLCLNCNCSFPLLSTGHFFPAFFPLLIWPFCFRLVRFSFASCQLATANWQVCLLISLLFSRILLFIYFCLWWRHLVECADNAAEFREYFRSFAFIFKHLLFIFNAMPCILFKFASNLFSLSRFALICCLFILY